MGVGPCVFLGTGFLGLFPYRVPVTTVGKLELRLFFFLLISIYFHIINSEKNVCLFCAERK